MAEDWDLYAVVRSCKSTTTTSSAATTTTTTAAAAASSAAAAAIDRMTGGKTMSSEDTLSCLASLTFEEENDPFSFPDLVEPRNNAFQELQEFYKPFFSNNPTTTITGTSTTTTHQGIIPNSSISDFGGSSGQQHQRQQQQHFGPQFSPQAFNISGTSTGFCGHGLLKRQQLHEQQDQNNQLLLKPTDQGQSSPVATTPTLPLPPLPLPTMTIPQTPRSRKRYIIYQFFA